VKQDGDPVLTVVEPLVVIRAVGELDLDNQDELERVVLEQLRTTSVVLDCSGLEFLSICALRSLEACAAAAQEVGHQFLLTRPRRQVRRLLAVAHMEHLLQDPAGR